MKKVRKISREYYLRQIVACWMVSCMLFAIPAQVALAQHGPVQTIEGPNLDGFVRGEGTINQLVDLVTDVTVHTPESIIHWNSLNTIGGEDLNFRQLGVDGAAVLNRVVTGKPETQFNGDLWAEAGMKIFMINPAGIVFGDGATINVTQLVASALHMSDDAFHEAAIGHKMVFAGGGGQVTIEGILDADGTGSLYFVGGNVLNDGSILCPDGLVVMAAGGEVHLAQPGSDVIVEVADLVIADNDNDVDNYGTVGELDKPVGKLVLAAGDVWSAAISNVKKVEITSKGTISSNELDFIDAYSGLGGLGLNADAEAEVVITSGGDITIDDDITAVADGELSDEFDAIASVTINAGGKVKVEDGSNTEVSAEAYNGVDNTASVSIAADGDIEVIAYGDDGDVTISADAYNGTNNNASVDLAAKGNVSIKARKSDAIVTASAYSEGDAVLNEAGVSITGKNVTIETYYGYGGTDPVTIGAYASDAEENNAKVEITANGTEEADGDVKIETRGGSSSSGSDDDEIKIEAVAHNGSDNSAKVIVSATKDIYIKADSDDDASPVKISALAHDGINNSALVGLNAEGNVTLEAQDMITVMAEAYGGGADAVLNQAQVNIDAVDVEIKGQDYGSENEPAQLIALAHDGQTNEAGVEILADGDVTITGEGKEDDGIVSVKAYNGDENYATVVINAVGDVEILSDDYPGSSRGDGAGLVEAWAYNEEDPATLNDADVQITGKNVTIEDRSDGDDGVEVLAIAYKGQTNNATIGITANGEGEEDGNVTVVDNSSGDDEGVLVKAEAYDGQQNTATVTIAAEGDVSVLANKGDAGILAWAHDAYDAEGYDGEVSNNAKVEIIAGGEVTVKSAGGDYDEWRVTPAYWTITVKKDAHFHITVRKPKYYGSGYYYRTYDAPSLDPSYNPWAGYGYVYYSHEYYDVQYKTYDTTHWYISHGWDYVSDVFHEAIYDSSFTLYVASIEAIAEKALDSSNTAGVDITAGDDVTVMALNGGQAFIDAYAAYSGGAKTNTANVTINTVGGDVLVHGVGGTYSNQQGFTQSEASIEAKAEVAYSDDEDAGKNTADVTINATATTNEYVFDGDGEVYVEVNGGDVKVIGVKGGNAVITAIAEDASDAEVGLETGENSASVTIHTTSAEGTKPVEVKPAEYGNPAVYETEAYTSGGDVKVKAKDGSEAAIQAEAKDATKNTADIKINASGDVKVIDTSGGTTAKIQALAHNEIDVLGSQTLEGIENIATIDITATNVEVRGDNGHAYIEADAHNLIDIIGGQGGTLDLTLKDLKNTAGVTITTTGEVDDGQVEDGDGDVLVIGYKGEADIDAEAFNEIMQNYYDPDYQNPEPDVSLTLQGPLENKADVAINAADDVAVHAFWGGDADIDAEAQNMLTGSYWYELEIVDEQGPITNNATVDITTGDTVEVEGIEAEAKINAEAWNYNENDWAEYGGRVRRWPLPDEFPAVKDNFATILIDAGGDVIVKGGHDFDSYISGGHAEIEALARYGVNNTATVDIDAVRDVRVTDIGGGGPTAKIEAIAEDAIKSNTANILIGAIDDRVGGNVEVTAGEVGRAGGNAYIKAIAKYAYGDFDDDNGDEGENTANVEIFADGDVEVTAVEGGYARIDAVTWDAFTNNSDVLICTDSLLVQGGAEIAQNPSGTADIKAIAHNGENNNAYVGIGARGDVEVLNYNESHSSITAKAFNPGDIAFSNIADVVICADGSVLVIDEGGPTFNDTAEILASATYGIYNTANVGICADHDADGDGDILVAADDGGSAWIRATAYADDYSYGDPPDEVTTSATANVVAVSHGGSVGVGALSGSEALIEAAATGAYTNTADVGIAAGQDIAPWDVPELEEPDVLPEDIDDILDLLSPGNVVVYGGDGGEAGIEAYAEYGVVNTADTVVCAPGTVVVISDDGDEPYIWAAAGGEGDLESANNATTQVYASDGFVSVGAYVGASTLDDKFEVYVTDDWSLGDPVPPSEGGATLILDDYSVRKDCPDCLPCPLCEEEEKIPVFGPAAALIQLPLDLPLLLQGCPVEIEAAANELGITAGAMQVSIGNALALNPTLQACDACATLIEAALILRDVDGSRMAAMTQMFNSMAPGSLPYTPEMQALIATAFAGAAEGSQYASVMEYTDAFVRYFSVIETDLASPVGDSLAFVMDKYGAGVLGSDNNNIAAFLAASLESGQTFGN